MKTIADNVELGSFQKYEVFECFCEILWSFVNEKKCVVFGRGVTFPGHGHSTRLLEDWTLYINPHALADERHIPKGANPNAVIFLSRYRYEVL